MSSFATYPIESIRDEVQKSPIKPPTITPKYDSNAMSTVLEWHVSLFLRNEIHDMICLVMSNNLEKNNLEKKNLEEKSRKKKLERKKSRNGKSRKEKI